MPKIMTDKEMIDMTDSKKLYEFCEHHYADLQKADHGYYPSRHDKVVFEAASNEFGVSENEAYEIYKKERQIVVDKYMEKVNRLPIPLRKRVLLEIGSNALRANKDNPFYLLEGEADERFLP